MKIVLQERRRGLVGACELCGTLVACDATEARHCCALAAGARASRLRCPVCSEVMTLRLGAVTLQGTLSAPGGGDTE